MSLQLARLHKPLATLITLETLVAIVRSQVGLQQGELGRPVLTALEGASVNISFVDSSVRGQVRVVFGAATESYYLL